MGFKDGITRTIGKGKLACKKHSPEILLVVGLISGGAALVTAVKSTLEADEIIGKHEEKINNIHKATELAANDLEVNYTPEDVKRDTVKAYIQTGWEFAKLYAPTVIFTGLSITCILTSHGILRKRNVALAASLATVRTAFDEYRGRVVRDLGKQMDEHFLYDTVEETVERETTDDNGKTKKVKEKVTKPKVTNCYSRFFDESNPNWEKDGFANYFFIRSQMLYLQQKLVAQGYLFLNDVYKELGLPISVAGQSAGWIYDFDNKASTQIFFEGFDNDEVNNSPSVRALMNGYERNVLLNFVNIKDDILTDLPRIDSSIDMV